LTRFEGMQHSSTFCGGGFAIVENKRGRLTQLASRTV
jgi:hypothetical protein